MSESLFEYRRADLVEVSVEAHFELINATAKFDRFNSPHEGWAVIREELDELWEHVKANTAAGLDARKEAIQIAAMAMRFAVDCGPSRQEREAKQEVVEK